jgi:FkbM family methyltransferase
MKNQIKKVYSRYFLINIEKKLKKIKNKKVLFLIFKYLYPLLFLKLPKFHINYKKINNNLYCLINTRTNKNFYFFNFSRISRYLIYNGFEGKGIALANDYQIVNNVEINENDIIIEVGPNIGELTNYFVSKKANVHLFEIDPLAIECLKLNFKNQNVILNECGAWNIEGETFVEFHSHDASSTLYIENTNTNSLIKVKTIKLSNYIKNLNCVKLLKIEAEGGEPEVLEGIEGFFYKIDNIAIDCGPERNKKTTFDYCRNFLEEKNFTCNIVGNYLFARNEK